MMKLDLKKGMENLKNITCELIDKLEHDNYDDLENLMDKRQNLLDDLKELNYTKEQYLELAQEFEIIQLQNKLSKMMGEKKHKLKQKIDNISKKRVVTKGYSKHIGASIFSKKI